jgi:hypothetical protein
MKSSDILPSAYKIIFLPTPSEATQEPQTERQVLMSSSAIEPTQLGEFVERDNSKVDAESADMDTFFLMEHLKSEAGTKNSAVTTESAKAVGDSASTAGTSVQNQQSGLPPGVHSMLFTPESSTFNCSQQLGVDQMAMTSFSIAAPEQPSGAPKQPSEAAASATSSKIDNVIRVLQHQQERLVMQHHEMQRYLAEEHTAQDNALSNLNDKELDELQKTLAAKHKKRADQLQLVQMNERQAQQHMHQTQIQHLKQQHTLCMQQAGTPAAAMAAVSAETASLKAQHLKAQHLKAQQLKAQQLEQNAASHVNAALALLQQPHDASVLLGEVTTVVEAAAAKANSHSRHNGASFVSSLGYPRGIGSALSHLQSDFSAGGSAMPSAVAAQMGSGFEGGDTFAAQLNGKADEKGKVDEDNDEKNKKERSKEHNREHARTSRLRKKYHLLALQERIWNLYAMNFTLLQKVIPSMPPGERNDLINFIDKGLAFRYVHIVSIWRAHFERMTSAYSNQQRACLKLTPRLHNVLLNFHIDMCFSLIVLYRTN